MRLLGIIEIILSGICFGFLGIFGKKAYEAGISSGEFLSFRFILSASILGIYLAVFQRKKLQLPLKNILQCLALGIFGYAVFSSCFFRALQGLSASLTVLLLYLYPVFVSIGSVLFLKEKMGLEKILAIPLQFIGLAIFVGVDWQENDFISLAFGIGSAFFYAVYILASSKFLKGVSAWSSVFYIQLGAAFVLGATYLHDAQRVNVILGHSFLLLLATAFIGSLLAMSFFLSALQKLSSFEVSILSTAEPVTGILLAILFLGEKMQFLQTIGAGMILGAMLLVAKKSKQNT